MTETSTELTLRQKTDQVIANLNDPRFLAQIEQQLPENVSLRKFAGVAQTAIRGNADLVKAEQTSLFASLIRCAQDGLYPDGKQAALVIYKGKVAYLPMIGGVRKIAGEYGWAIRTEVVYENDEFAYTTEPPAIHHRPLRPGMDRGQLAYAYAVAVHSDGRRLQKVMHPEEIAKRRAMAQTDAIWKAWTSQMWEKTVGHEIMDELPLSDHERFVRALAASKAASTDAADALEQLYGPEAVSEHVDLETGEITAAAAPPADDPHEGAAVSGEGQQAGTAVPLIAAVPVPGDDDDDEPGPARSQADELAAAAAVVGGTEIPNGNYQGLTLADVRDLGDEGVKWFAYVLPRASKYDGAFHAAVVVFVQGFLPELYAEWAAKAAA